MATTNKITNGNVYLNGVSHFGSIKEATLPSITAIMDENNALGNIGKNEFPAGIDKMDAKIVFNGPYVTSLVSAYDIFTPVLLTIRSSVDQFNASGGLSGRVGLIANMTATFKKSPSPHFEQQKNVDFETELNVTRFQLIIDGVEIVDFDSVAQIYRTGGVDRLANYRNLLGI